MDATNLTLLVIAVIGVISSYVTPKLLNRQQARKARDESTNVSWVSLNQAIVAERDKLKVDLENEQKERAAEVDAMREAQSKELAELRGQYGEQLRSLNAQLQECQTQVRSLYRELYELHRPSPGQPPIS